MKIRTWLTGLLGGVAFMQLSTSFAVPMDHIEFSTAQTQEKVKNVFADWEEAASARKTSSAPFIEEQQIQMVKKILERSRLFYLMLALENEIPSVAKQLSAMSILYEMKATNQTLSQMFSEMKKTNELIKQIDWPHINAHCDALDVWKKNE